MTAIVNPDSCLPSAEPRFVVLYVPQPFIGRDQAFFGAALSTTWPSRRPPHHKLQHVQKAPCHLDITLIAGVVECDQHMVG